MSKKNTEISELITQVIDFYKTNGNNFAKTLGYNRSQAIYDMLSGKAKPSFEFFNKFVLSEYSESISTDWLITGEGEMLKANTGENTVIAEVVHKSDPRDAEILAANKETIETQRELITTLKQRINDLERGLSHSKTPAFHTATSADTSNPSQTEGKAKRPNK